MTRSTRHLPSDIVNAMAKSILGAILQQNLVIVKESRVIRRGMVEACHCVEVLFDEKPRLST